MPVFDSKISDQQLAVYKASAGSGKTYTLTREYLYLSLKNTRDFPHILAITFTNAATEDMKKKVLESLYSMATSDLSVCDQNALLVDLSARLSLSQENLKARSAELLKEILYNYSAFSISTIDSFVQNNVRAFAYELGLPQNYEATLDNDALLSEAVDLLIEDCGQSGKEEETLCLVEFLQHQLEKEKTLKIKEIVKDISGKLFDEGSLSALKEMACLETANFRSKQKEINTYIRSTEDKIREHCTQAIKYMESHHLQAEDFHGGSQGVYAFFRKGLERNLPIENFSKPNSKVSKSVENGILKQPQDSISTLLNHYEAIQAIDFASYFLAVLIRKNIYALSLLNKVNEKISFLEQEKGLISVSKFNTLVHALVQNESAPFIYEKTASWYHHIFVDEFQDTSRLQWHNMIPLLSHNLANGMFNMLVGDPKQSIYRFRQANSEQFVQLLRGQACHDQDKEHGDLPFDDVLAIENNLSVKSLASNWRSEREIIAFNNAFYRFLIPKLGSEIEEVFKGHEQAYKTETEPCFPEASEKQERVRILFRPKEEKENWYLDSVVAMVQKHIYGNGVPACKPSEIAVLCRKAAQGNAVADALIRQGIRIVSPDSLLLKGNRYIHFLLSVLFYAQNPNDFGAYEIETHIEVLGLSCKNWQKKLLEEDILYNHPYHKIENIIRLFGIEKEADQYVLSFLDVLADPSLQSVSELKKWWEENKDRYGLATPQSEDAVNVMTIHKAKGLEFKVLIYPFANDVLKVKWEELHWIFPDKSENLFGLPAALVNFGKGIDFTTYAAQKETEKNKVLSDMTNLFYVATTRPREYMYILCDHTEKRQEAYNAWLEDFCESYPAYVFQEIEMQRMIECKDNFSSSKEDVFLDFPVCDWRKFLSPVFSKPTFSSPQIEWGNLIHEVLAKLSDEKSIEIKTDEVLLRYPRYTEKRDRIVEQIRQLITSKELGDYYLPGLHVKNEASILSADASLHRPDRLVFFPKQASQKNKNAGSACVIIDYKTGKASEKDIVQMKEYRRLLEEMSYICHQAILVYIGENGFNIVQLP